MAPTKSKKRAMSPVPSLEGTDPGNEDDDGLMIAVTRPRIAAKKARNDEWSTWQDSVRAQEADRVRQYVGTFQADVTAGRRKAMAVLRMRQDLRAESDAAYLERVRIAARGQEKATAAFGPEADQTTGTISAASDHPLYTASNEVLGLLHDILARYNQTNDDLKAISAGSGAVEAAKTAWDKDRAEASKLLRYGRAYGDGLVHNIIVPGSRTSTDKNVLEQKNLSQTGRSAIGLFPRSSEAVANRQTWGEAARTQMQALTGLIKTLPADKAATNEEHKNTSSEPRLA